MSGYGVRLSQGGDGRDVGRESVGFDSVGLPVFNSKLVTVYGVEAFKAFSTSACLSVAEPFIVIVAVLDLKSTATSFTSLILSKASRALTGQLVGQVIPPMPTA